MSEEKAIRVMSFSGKKPEWKTWRFKFLAKATTHGYLDVLTGVELVPNATEDLNAIADDAVRARKKKSRKDNALAYSHLALSCDGKAPLGLVAAAVTTDLPSGSAALAWERLCEKYAPTAKMSLVTLKQDFARCRLGNVERDPDEWIQELNYLRGRIGSVPNAAHIGDDDVIAHVLVNLPTEYLELVTAIESELERTGTTFTLEDLGKRLGSYYSRKFARDDEKSDNKIALLAG